jgi:Uma2 family endonuclease
MILDDAEILETLTEQDIARQDILYEVVDGQWMEKPAMGAWELGLANDLCAFLRDYLQGNPIGKAFVEMLYRLAREPRLERRPDVSFVPFERWPTRVVPEVDAWEIAPSLAVEIVSKTNTAETIQTKIKEYFKHGVSLVWVVYPRQRQIQVYDGPKASRILDDADALDGGKVLPGFQLPVVQFLGQPS